MDRFRRTHSLLEGHKELENQEIYFSDVASLNDPMEGFREYFWAGDTIIWVNFFKHYLLSLEHICMLAYLSEEGESLDAKDISVFIDEERLPTDQYRIMFNEICERFFSPAVNGYMEFLAAPQREIRRDELYVHLRLLHASALDAVLDIHTKHKLRPATSQSLQDHCHGLQKLVDLLQSDNGDSQQSWDVLTQVFGVLKESIQEQDLFQAYQIENPSEQKNWFILFGFPDAYLNEVVKLTYPEGYVACFMDDCTNAAVWGHYGDGHSGVCLKFRTQKNGREEDSIDLKCIVGWGSKPIYDYRAFPFRKINYTNQFPTIDFFRSLGRLPVGQLMRQWYTDPEGNRSQCSAHMKDKDSEDAWRRDYWVNFDSSFFVKLKDWEYEREQRLLLSSGLESFSEPESRKLKYRFEDLEAIIFGMKTSIQDKVKIMKIIDSKCQVNNRQDFDFYQAQYSPSLGKMEIRKLDISVSNKETLELEQSLVTEGLENES